jgi:hypothetical protein
MQDQDKIFLLFFFCTGNDWPPGLIPRSIAFEENLSAGDGQNLTEVFNCFPQSLQASSRIIPYIRPRPLSSICFAIHRLLIIVSFSAV